MNHAELLAKQKFQQRQSLPLADKIQMTKQRVKDWCEHWDFDVYISYSGGKDSHVLCEIIQSMGKPYSDIPMVFSNTGLEMPEILVHVRKQKVKGWNIEEVSPKMTYRDVWKKYGIPLVSKKVARQVRILKSGKTEKNKNMYNLYDIGVTKAGHSAPSWKLAKKWRKLVDADFDITELCCDKLKKEPFQTYSVKHGLVGRAITGMMADEGGYRSTMTTCNMFTGKMGKSSPMLFWTEENVWEYIEQNDVEICNVYYARSFIDGELVASDAPHVFLPHVVDAPDGAIHLQGEARTGCMFCAFGSHLEKGTNRFQRMSISHPRQHSIVMDRIGMRKPLEMIDVKVDFDDD